MTTVLEASRVVATPYDEAMERFIPVPLTDIFDHRHLALPAIKRVDGPDGRFDQVGQSRTIVLADGGSMVETLTVVIFVLVFYHLHGFEDGLSWMRRGRDAVIAGAAGITIALLVLFTAASGTTSRLSAYFIDAAPKLAHGRNVVNVILVDFRGFDTMGEITVLVTVAIGVRALLQMGKEGRP